VKKSAYLIGLELWEKKHLGFGTTALRPKFSTFHDVSNCYPCFAACSVKRIARIRSVKFAGLAYTGYRSTLSCMPTITSTDNKGRLKLDSVRANSPNRLAIIIAMI